MRLICKKWKTASKKLLQLKQCFYAHELKETNKKSLNFHYYKLNELHPLLDSSKRCILIDWLFDVQCEGYIQFNSLFCGMEIMDKFLSLEKNFPLKHYQMLGLCCTWISDKKTSAFSMDESELSYLTEEAFTPEQFLRMESRILEILGKNLEMIPFHLFVFLCTLVLYYSDDHTLDLGIDFKNKIPNEIINLGKFISSLFLFNYFDISSSHSFSKLEISCLISYQCFHLCGFLDKWPICFEKLFNLSYTEKLSKINLHSQQLYFQNQRSAKVKKILNGIHHLFSSHDFSHVSDKFFLDEELKTTYECK